MKMKRTARWRSAALCIGGVLPAVTWLGSLTLAPTPTLAQAPATAAGAAEQSGGVLTLDEALTMVRSGNRTLRAAALAVEAAQQKVGAARTRLLPQITMQAMGGRLLEPVKVHFPAGGLGTVNGSPVPSHDVDLKSEDRFSGAYNIMVAQPITQIPRIRNGIRMQEAGVELAQEQQRQRTQSNTAATRELYHAILQTKETIAAAEQQLAALRQMERTVEQNVKAETALQADLLEVQARRIKLEAGLMTARDTLQQLKEQMNLLLGRNTTTPFDVVPVSDDAPMQADDDALVTRALANRPELRSGALQVREAELDRRSTQLESVPDLSLTMNYSALHTDIDGLPDSFWTVGVMVSWDGLDWGRRGKEGAAKAKAVQQARLDLEEAAEQVRIDVRNQLRRWRQARREEEAARAARTAAEERLRVTTNQYGVHAALLKDVLQAQAALADTNREVQVAVLASLTAQSDLQRSLGDE